MIVLFAVAAASATDLAVTSIGSQFALSGAINKADPDLLFGQRLRWGLSDTATLDLNARFTYDPNAETSFEQSRVRSLGVTIDTKAYTLRAGRHALRHGGARLLDGAQFFYHPDHDDRIDVGLWAGFLADPFTTLPTLRPAGGPALAWRTSGISLSWLGEIVTAPNTDAGWDRVGTVLLVNGNLAPRASGVARADLLVRDSEGRSGLVDAAASGRLRLTPTLAWTADYNAFSSLRYQNRGAFDPTVRRFTERVQDLDLQDVVLTDTLDPTLQHTIGTALRFQPEGGDEGVVAALSTRARFHPDPVQRTAQLGPQVGYRGLLDGRMELLADGNVATVEGRMLGDVGFTAVTELLFDRNLLVDGSFRALIDPLAYSGQPGWYGDLFFDALLPSRTAVSVGGTWTLEPSEAVGSDVGWAAFLRLQQWVRRR